MYLNVFRPFNIIHQTLKMKSVTLLQAFVVLSCVPLVTSDAWTQEISTEKCILLISAHLICEIVQVNNR